MNGGVSQGAATRGFVEWKIAKLMVVVSCIVVTKISVGGGVSGGELWHASACRDLACFSANPCMHMCLHGAWILTRCRARAGEDWTTATTGGMASAPAEMIGRINGPQSTKETEGCGGPGTGVVHNGRNNDDIMVVALGAYSRADNGMAVFPSL
uniref:Uncharacterized protein n=1 Tax=Oryza meridionalis TaxID=40149 RepID=A0A0E0CZ28_9ORYZ